MDAAVRANGGVYGAYCPTAGPNRGCVRSNARASGSKSVHVSYTKTVIAE